MPKTREYSALRHEDVGPDVVALQKLLNKHGAKIEVTKSFDIYTHRAVKEFQKARGLVADGVVATLTWAALLADQGQPDDAP